MPVPVELKTVAVGDGGVGKTSMYITYATEEYPSEYIPTAFDDYSRPCDLNGTEILLSMFDTAGGEDYPRLRPLSYPGTDVFILCFDVSSTFSKDNISSYWLPELKLHCPTVPIILVATKIDLRDGEQETVTTEEGESLATKIGAAKYVEICSLRKEGLNELFSDVLRIGYDYNSSLPKKQSRKCNVL